MRQIDTGGTVFGGEGAVVVTIDRQGVVVQVESMAGTDAGPRPVGVPLADLLAEEDAGSALDEIRAVLKDQTSRFVTWTVREGGMSRPYAGWLHPNGGPNVVGVLRWFGT